MGGGATYPLWGDIEDSVQTPNAVTGWASTEGTGSGLSKMPHHRVVQQLVCKSKVITKTLFYVCVLVGRSARDSFLIKTKTKQRLGNCLQIIGMPFNIFHLMTQVSVPNRLMLYSLTRRLLILTGITEGGYYQY